MADLCCRTAACPSLNMIEGELDAKLRAELPGIELLGMLI